MGVPYYNENSRKVTESYELDLCGSGWEQLAGACECSNEHSGSIKCKEFISGRVSFLERTLLHGVSVFFGWLVS